jgi:hypothetical protein
MAYDAVHDQLITTVADVAGPTLGAPSPTSEARMPTLSR